MMERLEQRLARLPELAPPSSFAPNVMARIARLPDRVQAVTPARARSHRERFAPLWLTAGLLIVLAVTVDGLVGAASASRSVMTRLGNSTTVTVVTGLSLGLGLWLFLHGLFAPLRRRW